MGAKADMERLFFTPKERRRNAWIRFGFFVAIVGSLIGLVMSF